MADFTGTIRRSLLDKFKIPTLLGLAIVSSGVAGGVYLVLQQQTILSKASPDLAPQDMTITNITQDSVTLSWQTETPTISFINYGPGNLEKQAILDDRDESRPLPHTIHYVTLNNLIPKTNYQFKIISGRVSSNILAFETAPPLQNQTGFGPIIGFVLDGDIPLNDGVAYLIIDGATPQSSLIKPSGNFLIPISQLRNENLYDAFLPSEGTQAKLVIISDRGRASALLKLKEFSLPLPPLQLGRDFDLTTLDLGIPTPSPTTEELNKYDLNSDGKINAADNAIILQNFGPLRERNNPKSQRTDLNSDKVVDQKDIDLMAPHINE